MKSQPPTLKMPGTDPPCPMSEGLKKNTNSPPSPTAPAWDREVWCKVLQSHPHAQWSQHMWGLPPLPQKAERWCKKGISGLAMPWCLFKTLRRASPSLRGKSDSAGALSSSQSDFPQVFHLQFLSQKIRGRAGRLPLVRVLGAEGHLQNLGTGYGSCPYSSSWPFYLSGRERGVEQEKYCQQPKFKPLLISPGGGGSQY